MDGPCPALRHAALLIIAIIGGVCAVAARPATAHRITVERTAATGRSVVALPVIVVPDVTSEAFVFAKGVLDDSGFGWKVNGLVRGFAANTVAGQSPWPGTRVFDTGAPVVTLWLRRARSHPELGIPQNRSPYPATPLRFAPAR